jgi:hypothetical protein
MTIKGFSALKARHEDLKLGLDRRLQQFSRTFAQKFGQWVRDRISTGKFNNVALVYGGASASVGGLCRNDNPTRCTASFQIPKTPDLVMARANLATNLNRDLTGVGLQYKTILLEMYNAPKRR